MSILPRMIALYEQMGFTISTGLDSRLTGDAKSEMTFIFDEYDSITNNLGISLKEVYFFECFFGALQSERATPLANFIIGNSFGWSTFAIALAAPQSHTVALELADEPMTKEWLTRTNLIAGKENLNVDVVEGRSPGGIKAAIAPIRQAATGGTAGVESDSVPCLDTVFIDGEHTNEAVIADIDGVVPHLKPDGVILLHDVMAFNMSDGVRAACDTHGFQARLLPNTNSGVTILHRESFGPSTERVLRSFGNHVWSRRMVAVFREGQIPGSLPPEAWGEVPAPDAS